MLSTCRHYLKLLLLFFVLCAPAACGGGGGGEAASGGLSVIVNGLPAGVAAAVSVTGPGNYTQTLTQSRILDQLRPGLYTVAAANVANAGATLAPTPPTQQVQVNAGASASASVLYAAQKPLALSLQAFASGLAAPVFLGAPAGDSRQFIVERAGRIRIIENGALLAAPFLDIRANTGTDGERGLLSMAFHPQYASNRQFFIYYTDLEGNIVIERRSAAAANANLSDPLSALTILSIPHPNFSNHYGGLLSFGPDGYLYAGTGDGGSAGDPPGNAQNTRVLLGKLLRLDVNNATLSQPYAIPSDNPFASQVGSRPEIWAYGLRNPWRYAFDGAEQRLYIADVGQAQREEVDIAPGAQGGNNYGWNLMEGTLCYNSSSCVRSGLTLPLLEYDHNQGCSITGGYVYRGQAIPELRGRYLYSDYCGGWLKSFFYNSGSVSETVDWGIANVGNIVSFGQDGLNELYMLSTNGTIYRIVRAP